MIGGNRTNEVTVLAIDNSMSMQSGTKMSQAKNEAKSAVNGLRLGQKAQVLAFGSRVQVMSEVTDDHNSLKAAVDSVEPGDARTSYAELSRSVRSIVARISSRSIPARFMGGPKRMRMGLACQIARVLGQAVQRVGKAGVVMVGDVRSLPLLEAFHASVVLSTTLSSSVLCPVRVDVKWWIVSGPSTGSHCCFVN